MKIFAYNPSVSELEKTFLTNSTAIGATVFKVKNSNNFANTLKVLVGEMSRERSEILTIASLTSVQLTLSAALFPHDSDDPIYLLKYDQVRVYRSTTGENGTYSLLDTINIDVDNAEGKTWYDDENALGTYWYKVSYFDSVGMQETEKSSAVQATGYAENSFGKALLEVVAEVGDKAFMVFEIEDWIGIANSISDDLLTQAKRPYRFLKRTAALDADEGEDSAPFPTDFWKVNYVEVNEDLAASTRVFRPKKVSATEMRFRRAETPLDGDYVNEIAYDDENNLLLFNPAALTDRIGAFNFHYYKKFDRITSLSSLLETPNTLVYKLGLKRAFYLKKMDDDAKYERQYDKFDRSYNAEVMKLQREKNIEADGPTGMGPDRKRYPQWGGRRYRQ